MNERIRELMLEAEHGNYGRIAFSEKFAELIIRECLSIVEEDNGIQSLPIVIKEHFGVEE